MAGWASPKWKIFPTTAVEKPALLNASMIVVPTGREVTRNTKALRLLVVNVAVSLWAHARRE